MFAEGTASLLSDLATMNANPFLVDDYANLLWTAVRTASKPEGQEMFELIMTSGFVRSMLQFCTGAVVCRAEEPVRRANDVLNAFFAWHNGDVLQTLATIPHLRGDAVKHAVAGHVRPVGPTLVHALIKAVVLNPPQNEAGIVKNVAAGSAADVLLGLKKMFPTAGEGAEAAEVTLGAAAAAAADTAGSVRSEAVTWLKDALDHPDFVCSRVTEALKGKLCDALERTVLVGATTATDAVNFSREMKIFARLYHPTLSKDDDLNSYQVDLVVDLISKVDQGLSIGIEPGGGGASK